MYNADILIRTFFLSLSLFLAHSLFLFLSLSLLFDLITRSPYKYNMYLYIYV